jgi:histidinol-phosphate phosphatase family protein
MVITSIPMPVLAVGHHVRGRLELRRTLQSGGPQPDLRAVPPAAVLLDRDDTLIEDVPYNGDPAKVRPLSGARSALDRLRAAGCRLVVVSNQSGIGRGIVTEEQVRAVNARVAELLGPFEYMIFCPHAPGDGCGCRKPKPGMVERALALLDLPPSRAAMIGDIGGDVRAAAAAGVRGILVPTRKTRPEEIAAAPERTVTLAEAVDRLIGADDGEEALAA